MRTIIFRGKRIDTNEWVYGDLWRAIGQNITSHVIRDGHGNMTDNEVNPDTIGQFTGLTDKNGNEIYEGDVCKVYSIDCGTENLSVVFYQGAFCFSYHNWSINEWKQHNIEIIGNTTDTPELA